MENKKFIRIRGAAENNLKHIDLDIPRDELVVLTGLSGSGKSSLAFDTIYAFSYTISFVTAFACFTSAPFSFCAITIAKTITTHTTVIASIIQTI